MLDIADRPGCITKAEMRGYFERVVDNTPMLRARMKLGVMEVNGEFTHYMNPDTDNMWIGFALGMRCAERLNR